MNSLLDQLRKEVIGLREQTASFTKQMWLLYVTFEDFVCLQHPERSKDILSSAIDIDSYLNKPTLACTKSSSSAIVACTKPKGSVCRPGDSNTKLGTLNATYKGNHTNEIHISKSFAASDKLDNNWKRPSFVSNQKISTQQSDPAKSLGEERRRAQNCSIRRSQSMEYSPRQGRDCNDRLRDYNLNAERCYNVYYSKTHGSDRLADRGTKTTDWNKVTTQVTQPRDSQLSEVAENARGRNDNCFVKTDNYVYEADNPLFRDQLERIIQSREGPARRCGVVKRGSGNVSRSSVESPPAAKDDYSANLFQSFAKQTTSGSRVATDDIYSRVCKVPPVPPFDIGLGIQREPHVADEVPESDSKRSRDQEYLMAQFDDLLRGIGGDSPNCAYSEQSSPVNTISSGYESDYMASPCDAEIEEIFSKRTSTPTIMSDEFPTDYFSQSDIYPQQFAVRSASAIGKPTTPETSNSVSESRVKGQTCDSPRPHRSRRDSGEKELDVVQSDFSHTQRQNYQLSKVTRSMYEIIYDLQSDESERDTKKKGKKSKRALQYKETKIPTSPHCASQSGEDKFSSEMCFRTIQSSSDDSSEVSIVIGGSADSDFSDKQRTLCVRCPLRSDSAGSDRLLTPRSQEGLSPSVECSHPQNVNMDRKYPHGDKATASLSDTPKTTGCIDVIPKLFDSEHTSNRTRVCFPDTKIIDMQLDSLDIHTKETRPVTRRPTFRRESSCKEDNEHIYETIPGDEADYQELGKVKSPRVQHGSDRFVALPDFPGSFYPYNPPALPVRSYLRGVPEPETAYPCVFSPDSCSSNLSTTETSYSDAGYVSTSDKNISPSPQKTVTRMDDGYCSLDQSPSLSESIAHVPDSMSSFPEDVLNKWNTADLLNYIDGIRQPPPKRRENIYLLLDSKQTRAEFSESLEIENKLKKMGVLDNESDIPVALSPAFSELERNCVKKQIIHATYV